MKHHYLRLLLAVICLTVAVSGTAYLVGTYHFYKTHFNSNVTINGVNVGRMSEQKAYETVNDLGNNWVVLRDGQIHVGHYRNSNDFITMSEIHKYHSQQYEAFGSDKTWNFAPHNLAKDRKKLDQLRNETVTYRLNGHDYKLKATDLFDVIHYADGRYHFDSDDGFNQQFDKISAAEETLNKQYQINDPDGKPIKVKNESYGWEIDQDATEEAIKQAFIHDSGFVDGQKYIRGVGYTTRGTGYGVKDNHGLGKNYVVVSLDQQKLWIYKDGQPVVTLDDVVTGTADPKLMMQHRRAYGISCTNSRPVFYVARITMVPSMLPKCNTGCHLLKQVAAYMMLIGGLTGARMPTRKAGHTVVSTLSQAKLNKFGITLIKTNP